MNSQAVSPLKYTATLAVTILMSIGIGVSVSISINLSQETRRKFLSVESMYFSEVIVPSPPTLTLQSSYLRTLLDGN